MGQHGAAAKSVRQGRQRPRDKREASQRRPGDLGLRPRPAGVSRPDPLSLPPGPVLVPVAGAQPVLRPQLRLRAERRTHSRRPGGSDSTIEWCW